MNREDMEYKIKYLKSVLDDSHNDEDLDTMVSWLYNHMKDLVNIVEELVNNGN